MLYAQTVADVSQSLPVRGAWIEITGYVRREMRKAVAPCEGSVD